MKQQKQSTVFTLMLFCAFLSLLLAACGSSNQAVKLKYNTQHISRQTKFSATATPVTNGQTEYVGEIPEANAWFGLTSDGKNVTALATDGSPDHTATFAQWYTGPVRNGVVMATPITQATPSATAKPTARATSTSTNSSEGLLTARLSQNAAIGKITLSNGKSFPFTANAITDPNSPAGLYGSQETINDVKYQAGWIIPPSAVPGMPRTPEASATPSATGTPTPPATTTTSPTDDKAATPAVTATATAGAAPEGGSAITNLKTGELLRAPMPTALNLATKQISVPNLGTFNLQR